MGIAIWQGRRYRVISQQHGTVALKPLGDGGVAVRLPVDHADLLLNPTAEDLDLADAYERGEISAFEYADGHTYPPNREIRSKNPWPHRRDDDVH